MELSFANFLFYSSSVREIQKIKIHPSPVIDLWTPASNGVFSTKSTYKLISSLRPPLVSSPPESKHWSLLWNLKLNARHKLLLWKIAWDILPTKARLKTIISISAAASLCPLCSLKKTLYLICFLVAIWPELPRDLHFGLLTP